MTVDYFFIFSSYVVSRVEAELHEAAIQACAEMSMNLIASYSEHK